MGGLVISPLCVVIYRQSQIRGADDNFRQAVPAGPLLRGVLRLAENDRRQRRRAVACLAYHARRAGGARSHVASQPGRCTDRAELRSHRRSEEHTSELQSLMRISYAVFCLKKKTQKTDIINALTSVILQRNT